ncbi:PREDICTED: putative disease resistance RPP13-like protein 1 [Theobroma cacao]|uniref:Disease resistance RPP13-like protein 1 n=1 Tax=Theobroma cacao TaxID=3641 RepID=A0AB32WKY5_THECC|nr:PREDICTED: putative disease resistance RPP13-like protein 1 [Theobroma cacao]
MAEAIPYGTVSNILSKLVWLAGQELGFIFGLNTDLEKLQETLSTINAVLRDAEEKQESNHAVDNWIIRLQDVVFDAEDLLDEFDYAILRQKVRPRGQMEVLPDAIVKLHKLQTLLLYDCRKLKELPRDIRQLISLEYLNIDQCNGLQYLPKGLGELTSLQTLHRFIVNSFSTAATLNELRDLDDLGNYLSIENLDDVKNVELESMEANLKTKKRLQSLKLDWWTYPRGDDKKDELLLDNLQPHPNLKKLELQLPTPATLASSFISPVSYS